MHPYRDILLAKRAYLHILLFFFNDTATTEIYTLSLHDALPISVTHTRAESARSACAEPLPTSPRSEEHTSELQSRVDLVCRRLLEKKKRTRSSCATGSIRHQSGSLLGSRTRS